MGEMCLFFLGGGGGGLTDVGIASISSTALMCGRLLLHKTGACDLKRDSTWNFLDYKHNQEHSLTKEHSFLKAICCKCLRFSSSTLDTFSMFVSVFLSLIHI